MTFSRPAHSYDVIVVGGGPAGSAMGWALAKEGVRVAILERVKFPREKVCGDYVEPGGLRILEKMGALSAIESRERLRITRNRVYFGPKLLYKGDIHYYDRRDEPLNYGLVVPRSELDAILLDTARNAGAHVLTPGEAKSVARVDGMMQVEAAVGGAAMTLRAPLVVGADGTESIVGRSIGQHRKDKRHIGLAQRAYVEGVELDEGEAAVWFDEDIAPGYGWMFPMPGGLANVGIGFSSETSERFGIRTPENFRRAIERLRIRHPGCAKARIVGRPIGGVVKAYSSIDKNHFDGGLLIGDAGSFADPMTGEGITQGMESAILAAPTLVDALNQGRFEADDLASFEHDFRGYFDPAMRYLELCAALVSNRHMLEFGLRVWAHGHDEAAKDDVFARISGSIFGGPALQPLAVTAQMLTRTFARYTEAIGGDAALSSRFAEDFQAFKRGWTASTTENPEWHAEWLKDIVTRTFEVQKTIWTKRNPRPDGVFRFLEGEASAAPIPLAEPDTKALVAQAVGALVSGGLAFLSARPQTRPPVEQDAEPRRRWRAKP